jgi:hypothetical protein
MTLDSVENQNIRDQFIVGLTSNDIRKRLLSENNLTLARAEEIALAMETACRELSEMSANKLDCQNSNHHTLVVRPKSQNKICYHCGISGHVFKFCRKRNVPKCTFCKKLGHNHFSCWQKKSKSVPSSPRISPKKDSSALCLTLINNNSIKKVEGTFYHIH